MAALKKKKAPTRKASTGKAAAPRALPNDEAWRKLVATALENREPERAPAKAGSTVPARKKAPKK